MKKIVILFLCITIFNFVFGIDQIASTGRAIAVTTRVTTINENDINYASPNVQGAPAYAGSTNYSNNTSNVSNFIRCEGEEVNERTLSFSFTNTDAVIPGKNGLDVVLKTMYSENQSYTPQLIRYGVSKNRWYLNGYSLPGYYGYKEGINNKLNEAKVCFGITSIEMYLDEEYVPFTNFPGMHEVESYKIKAKALILGNGQRFEITNVPDSGRCTLKGNNLQNILLFHQPSYDNYADFFVVRYANGDEEYLYGTSKRYNIDNIPPGKMFLKTDKYYNEIKYNYSNFLLRSIEDTYGQFINFYYGEHDVSVGLPDGRSFKYIFNDSDWLTSYIDVNGKTTIYNSTQENLGQYRIGRIDYPTGKVTIINYKEDLEGRLPPYQTPDRKRLYVSDIRHYNKNKDESLSDVDITLYEFGSTNNGYGYKGAGCPEYAKWYTEDELSGKNVDGNIYNYVINKYKGSLIKDNAVMISLEYNNMHLLTTRTTFGKLRDGNRKTLRKEIFEYPTQDKAYFRSPIKKTAEYYKDNNKRVVEESYSYDDFGNVTTHTDVNKVVHTYGYYRFNSDYKYESGFSYTVPRAEPSYERKDFQGKWLCSTEFYPTEDWNAIKYKIEYKKASNIYFAYVTEYSYDYNGRIKLIKEGGEGPTEDYLKKIFTGYTVPRYNYAEDNNKLSTKETIFNYSDKGEEYVDEVLYKNIRCVEQIIDLTIRSRAPTQNFRQVSNVVFDVRNGNCLYSSSTVATRDSYSQERKTTYKYDNLGRLINEKNKLGNMNKWEYTEQEDNTIFGKVNTIKYTGTDDIIGTVNFSKNPERTIYDGCGREIGKEQYQSDKGKWVILYKNSYDIFGNVVTKELYPTTDNDEKGVTTYEYDDLKRLTKIINPAVTKGITSGATYVEIRYDDVVNKKTIIDEKKNYSSICFNNAGNKTYQTYLFDKTNMSGDIFENMIPGQTSPYILTQSYVYDSLNRLSSKTENGANTQYGYDSLGNLVSTSALSASGTINTVYEYDLAGNLVRKKMGGSDPETVYDALYDGTGKLLEEIDDFRNRTEYSYDHGGNNTSIRLKDSKIIYKRYNSGGNLEYIFVDYSGAGITNFTNQVPAVKYNYYASGRLESIEYRQCTETGISSTVQKIKYTYDYAGRIKTILYQDGKTLTYDYDNLGNVISLKDNTTNGTALSLTHYYDERNRRYKTKYNANEFNTNYDLDNSIISEVFPNGKKNSYKYWDNGKLKKQVYSEGGKEISNEYRYESGNIVYKSAVNTWNNSIPDVTTYNYTNGMLDYSINTGNEEQRTDYKYDEKGNIAEETIITGINASLGFKKKKYIYGLNNMLTDILEQGTKVVEGNEFEMKYEKIVNHFNYDSNGNMTERIVNGNKEEYKYNIFNQMVGYNIAGAKKASYEYFPDGMRASKTVSGIPTKFYYDGAYILEEVKNNNEIAHNIYGINGIIGRNTGTLEFYIKNGHGDVVGTTPYEGLQLNRTYRYDDYGVVENVSTISTGILKENPFGYSGEYTDSETGFQYLRARYYLPEIRRFTSEDSYTGDITNPLSLNLYAYCQGNPIMYTDPSGHDPMPSNVTSDQRDTVLSNSGHNDDRTNNAKERVKNRHKNDNAVIRPKTTLDYVDGVLNNPNVQMAVSIACLALSVAEPLLLVGEAPIIEREIQAVEKAGLRNPFKDKTAKQIEEKLIGKGFEPRGPDPLNGKGGYVNPKNDRSYHIDMKNSFNEPAHVDVNRPKNYKGSLEKKKYYIED